MPRTVEEILAHGDELAARFETYDPDPAHELDAEAVALLRVAVTERSACQSGMTWSAIGSLVGTTGEAARQHYANKVA